VSTTGKKLDPSIIALAKAIRWRETEKLGNAVKDPWTHKSKDGGEGAYQFTGGTFREWGKRYLGNGNLPMTKENQNRVAYARLSHLKEQGLNPAEIAAVWNGGTGMLKGDKWKTHKGVNAYGVHYDVPAYVKDVYAKYKEFSATAKKVLPKEEQLASMSHVDLYKLRDEWKDDKDAQEHLAPYEHRAFARELTAENPALAPVLGIAVPGYAAAKLAGLDMGDPNSGIEQTPPSLEQIKQSFTGIYEGLRKRFATPTEATNSPSGDRVASLGDGNMESP